MAMHGDATLHGDFLLRVGKRYFSARMVEVTQSESPKTSSKQLWKLLTGPTPCSCAWIVVEAIFLICPPLSIGLAPATLPPNVPPNKANKMTKFQLRGFRIVTSQHDFPKQFQHPTASKGMKSEFASASARSFNISCLLTARNSTHFTSTMPCQNTAPDFELWLPFLVGPEVPSWIDWLLRSCSSRCVLTWHHGSCVAKISFSSYLWWMDIMGFSPEAALQKAKGALRPAHGQPNLWRHPPRS